MAARSLNKAILIGNLTRDPELRYTPQGTPVCTFGVATNRDWTVESGEKKEETEFHRVVAWNKLAELCSQLLFKGRRVYIEGRLQTRQWNDRDNNQRQTTEIVASEMIILDNKRADDSESSGYSASQQDRQESQPAEEESSSQAGEAGDEAEKVQQEAQKAVEKAASEAEEKKEEASQKKEKAAQGEPQETASADEVSEDIPF